MGSVITASAGALGSFRKVFLALPPFSFDLEIIKYV